MLDSRAPTRKVQDFLLQQTRFKMLSKTKPEDAKRLWKQAQHDADVRYRLYEYLAQRKPEQAPGRRGNAPSTGGTGGTCEMPPNAGLYSKMNGDFPAA